MSVFNNIYETLEHIVALQLLLTPPYLSSIIRTTRISNVPPVQHYLPSQYLLSERGASDNPPRLPFIYISWRINNEMVPKTRNDRSKGYEHAITEKLYLSLLHQARMLN